MNSISDIDLSPKKGKKYWKNCHREWREEFIYFLMLDRFHDSVKRHPVNFNDRHTGFGESHQLRETCGGTIRGIIDNLDYIKHLGCTAIWLSPVFENNQEAYHGYAIQDYLDVDKRWGTIGDMEELVTLAHDFDMRVFLDIVLHFTGNNWSYADKNHARYNGMEFPFGGWRFENRPLPIEFRNPFIYFRKGQITNFDAYPETREGDFFGLKSFHNDDSPVGDYVLDLLVKIYSYWIRETDVDGFRIDAAKHIGELTMSRFCSAIREYAYTLGKKNFFLFGELIAADEVCNHYIGPKTSLSLNDKNIYYGLNSVLDFPLYNILAGVIKGTDSAEKLIDRYTSLQKNAMGRGEYGEFLVTFIDNHDQVGEEFKHRFGYNAEPEQIIAGIGFLLCAIGTPCIYYGTEQGLEGCGRGDWYIRECMFDPDDKSTNILNQQSHIYKQIAEIAHLRQKENTLKFGRMFLREISSDSRHFHLPNCPHCTLAFSRILFEEEILVVYNSSPCDAKEEYILIDATLNKDKKNMNCIYGKNGTVEILKHGEQSIRFIKLFLRPMQFVILKNK
jgi:alpha-amylase